MKLTTSNEREVLFALRKQPRLVGRLIRPVRSHCSVKYRSMPLEDAVLLQIGQSGNQIWKHRTGHQFSQGEFIIENPPENVGNVNQLLTEVVLQSDSYTGIEKFVDEIEKMERIFIIDSINFNVPE